MTLKKEEKGKDVALLYGFRGYPLELYERLEGGGCRFWGLNHEMLLIEMLERGRIGSPDAWSEIEPWGKSGMQAHFLASRQA